MKLPATCKCGGATTVEKRSDLALCGPCDLDNKRAVALVAALMVRVDFELALVLARAADVDHRVLEGICR